ncbi:MAG: phosphoglycerate mutase family protein [Clostridiales bacterium]|jgi:probable phosphoglycerate mutase|nr:phosphoglycerate mutase family protein [Clostridiales bacterium]
MKNIITIQHTQSVHHVNAMIGGQGDWSLTELGIKQADKIGENLALEIDGSNYIMYSSDLLRAKQTAENAGRHLGIKPVLTAALREINCGTANGVSKEESRKIFLGSMKTIDDKSYPGAESMRDVWNRLREFLNEIMTRKEENIIIVAHGISLGIFNMLWLGLNVEVLNTCGMWGSSGSVSFMREESPEFGAKRIITRFNDCSYSR